MDLWNLLSMVTKPRAVQTDLDCAHPEEKVGNLSSFDIKREMVRLDLISEDEAGKKNSRSNLDEQDALAKELGRFLLTQRIVKLFQRQILQTQGQVNSFQTTISTYQAALQYQVALSQQQVVLSQQQVALSQQQVVLSQQQVAMSQQQVVLSQQQVAMSQQQVVLSQQQVVLSQQQVAMCQQQVAMSQKQVEMGQQKTQIAHFKNLEDQFRERIKYLVNQNSNLMQDGLQINLAALEPVVNRNFDSFRSG